MKLDVWHASCVECASLSRRCTLKAAPSMLMVKGMPILCSVKITAEVVDRAMPVLYDSSQRTAKLCQSLMIAIVVLQGTLRQE